MTETSPSPSLLKFCKVHSLDLTTNSSEVFSKLLDEIKKIKEEKKQKGEGKQHGQQQ